MSAKAASKKASEAREAGNAAYKKGKWVDAIGHYTTASVLAPQDPAPLLNRAQAYLKIEKWQDCERDCTKVLGLAGQSGNVKALYRRALARKERKLYAEARNDLEVLLKAEPANAAAKEELAELKKLIKTTSNAPPKKKSPQDISTFAELTTKKTTPKETNLPPRNRSQAVKIPIKVVSRFTTTPVHPQSSETTIAAAAVNPPVTKSDSGPSESAPTPPTPLSPNEGSTSAFASHKASRTAKTSFTRSRTEVEVRARESSEINGRTDVEDSQEVKPPASGLELVDRLQELSEDDEQRWRLLRSVNPQRVTSLLGGILEPDHLALIYQTLAHHQRGTTGSTAENEKIRLYLQALRRIPRWQMTEALLLPEERQMGDDVWKTCNR